MHTREIQESRLMALSSRLTGGDSEELGTAASVYATTRASGVDRTIYSVNCRAYVPRLLSAGGVGELIQPRVCFGGVRPTFRGALTAWEDARRNGANAVTQPARKGLV
jgi:hypothetical protein